MFLSMWQIESHLNDVIADVIAIVADGMATLWNGMMNILLTPSKLGVLQCTAFSHTPDKAMLGWLVKACYYWKIILF